MINCFIKCNGTSLCCILSPKRYLNNLRAVENRKIFWWNYTTTVTRHTSMNKQKIPFKKLCIRFSSHVHLKEPIQRVDSTQNDSSLLTRAFDTKMLYDIHCQCISGQKILPVVCPGLAVQQVLHLIVAFFFQSVNCRCTVYAAMLKDVFNLLLGN